MAKMSSIAHPYAVAAFELAKAGNTIDIWLEQLRILSQILQISNFRQLMSNPTIKNEEVLQILLSGIDNYTEEIKKFLELLQENRRLEAIPDIFDLFEELVAKTRNSAKAIIQTPFAMDKAEIKQFEQLLGKKYAKDITVTVELKPELIGGIKILIDDMVIDASVKHSLEKMATQLIV